MSGPTTDYSHVAIGPDSTLTITGHNGKPLKVVQIAAMSGLTVRGWFRDRVSTTPALYALCSDGSVWVLVADATEWQSVRPVRKPSPTMTWADGFAPFHSSIITTKKTSFTTTPKKRRSRPSPQRRKGT